jgi:ribulose-phosphate 3-epimerase
VKRMTVEAGREILICVDGGITKSNVAEIARTGVDLVVAGSAIFDGKAARENARMMLQAVASTKG